MEYVHNATTGNVHVDIDLSPDEKYYLCGQVWNEDQEKIDFFYSVISHPDSSSEQAILPKNLPPQLQKAILEAAQNFLEALD